ncbi:MAG: C25 family cysteine peptidase [bacterium]
MKKVSLLIMTVICLLTFAEEGARYLIITTDALAPVIRPLAEWKHCSGMQCKVVKLSEIGTPADTTAIKNYIRNAYNNWPVRPEYVLLVGSPSSLPARFYRVNGQGYYSDNIYGDVNSDLSMDIPVGRFNASSAVQCSVLVAKTLAYERHPDLTDTLWMRRLTTVVRENEDSDDTIYWNDIRLFARLADSNGFVGCDSLSYMRGHTRQNVINSVNNGTGIVIYRGNAVNNWYQPFNVNPYLTSNGKKLPIILSITCETMTLAPGEQMVADSWVKAGTVNSLKGAVAFFGNTHSLASSNEAVRKRSAVARAFAKALFTEGKTNLGLAMIRAKDSLYRAFSDATEYRGFNLLGDPNLDIWTATPKLPTIEHPEVIPPEPQEFTVRVLINEQPFQNALVCISMDTLIYEYGYTDDSGAISFNINPPDTGSVRLVITGHNLYPYDTLIPVAQVGINEFPATIAHPKVVASPQVFRHSTHLVVENLNSSERELVIFDAVGRPVRTLNSIRTQIVWDGADENGIPCPAGVYLLGLRNSSLWAKVLKVR